MLWSVLLLCALFPPQVRVLAPNLGILPILFLSIHVMHAAFLAWLPNWLVLFIISNRFHFSVPPFWTNSTTGTPPISVFSLSRSFPSPLLVFLGLPPFSSRMGSFPTSQQKIKKYSNSLLHNTTQFFVSMDPPMPFLAWSFCPSQAPVGGSYNPPFPVP